MIDGRTRIFGVLGDPISHSLSPAMHNAAFSDLDINAVYLPFHVKAQELGNAVAGIRAMNVTGVNVTVPHKEKIMIFLDEVDADAQIIGAVNTVVNQEGKLTGFNTDSLGFLRSLQTDLNFDPRNKKVLVLGAGGACRAILTALSRSQTAWIGVVDIVIEKAEALATEFSGKFPGTQFAWFCCEPAQVTGIFAEIDLLVNATPIGLKGEKFEGINWQQLPPTACIYDIVYAFPATPLVQSVRDRGYRAADGLGMLIAQGEEAFFLWNGKWPPEGSMRKGISSLVQRE
ncbi:MAG: shikimate dehydrogenase [Deltaproteobacteria bacterium]|nr:shikimate dehydrogenase [Deltaproteobacteria bacterium]